MKKTKILGIMTFGFISTMVSYSQALAGSCGDNCIYTIDDQGNVVISGYGTVDGLESADKSLVTTITFDSDSNFTSIGDSAFNYAPSLTSIDIPDSVTSIGYEAFIGANNLTALNFSPNSQLTEIELNAVPSGTNIILPPNVTSITYGGNPVYTLENNFTYYTSGGGCGIN